MKGVKKSYEHVVFGRTLIFFVKQVFFPSGILGMAVTLCSELLYINILGILGS
jgi:hypothetical protein